MPLIRNSSQVTVEFTPWTDNDKFRVVRLHMFEKLGGVIAGGEMNLWHDGTDDAFKLVTDQKDGTITLVDEKEEGLTYVIPIYITDRKSFGNTLDIKFVCISDPTFFTTRVSTYYKDGIKATIEATYPGKKDIRIEPGVSDPPMYFQHCETNYEFNKRLSYSYKAKSVFAYGLEGYLMKDLMGEKDHRGNTEPKLILKGTKLMHNSTQYNLKYDKKLQHDPFNPWPKSDESPTSTDHSSDESANACVVMKYDSYTIVGRDLEPHMQNTWLNQQIMKSGGYNEFKSIGTDMPSYKLGDVVIYQRSEQEETYPFVNYLIMSNEVFYSIDGGDEVDSNGFKFSWTTIMVGLDSGIWADE